jgi:hypothetical protein
MSKEKTDFNAQLNLFRTSVTFVFKWQRNIAYFIHDKGLELGKYLNFR